MLITEIYDREDVRSRISKMDIPRRTLFAMACVTHGRETFIASVGDEFGEWCRGLAPMIEEFWESFPDSLDQRWLRKQEDATESLRNRDEELNGLGEDELKIAASCAFGTADPAESLANTTNAAHQVYWMIVQSELIERGFEGADDYLSSLERENVVCLSELEFQIQCLRVIESSEGELPTYDKLVEQLDATNRDSSD